MQRNLQYDNITKLDGEPFGYVLVSHPVDRFYGMLTAYELSQNVIDGLQDGDPHYYNYPYTSHFKDFPTADLLEEYISKFVEECSGVVPHTIRYTCIPTQDHGQSNLVAVAKIDANGTCYIFSDNLSYLQWLLSIME